MAKQTSELTDAAIGTICGVRGEQRWNSPFALDPHRLAGHLDQQFEGRQRARCCKTGGEVLFSYRGDLDGIRSRHGRDDGNYFSDRKVGIRGISPTRTRCLPRTRATSPAPRQNRPQTSGCCTSERTRARPFSGTVRSIGFRAVTNGAGFPRRIGDETTPDGGFDPAWRSTDATTALALMAHSTSRTTGLPLELVRS